MPRTRPRMIRPETVSGTVSTSARKRLFDTTPQRYQIGKSPVTLGVVPISCSGSVLGCRKRRYLLSPIFVSTTAEPVPKGFPDLLFSQSDFAGLLFWPEFVERSLSEPASCTSSKRKYRRFSNLGKAGPEL